MCDCLGNNIQVFYTLFGEFVQTIVSVVHSVVFGEIQKVILAEYAGFLGIIEPHFIWVERYVSFNQRIDASFLLSFSRPFVLFKQVFVRNVNPTLQLFLLLNHSQLSHFLALFLLSALLEARRPPDILTNKRTLDLLAHLLT